MKIKPPFANPVLPDGDVFVVTRNSDLTEGRGRSVDHGFYDDLDEAVEAAKGIDVQGSDGTVFQVTQLLPEQRVQMWGQQYLNEFKGDAFIYYTGFSVASGRSNEDIAKAVKSTKYYREYVRLKEIMEKYGVA